MILHVGELDKFIPSFIELVKEEFTDADHQFWLTGSVNKYPVKSSSNIYISGNRVVDKFLAYVRLVKQLHASRKIMLHGLFNIRVVLALAVCPWLLPKCYWMIWGGDLYLYTKAKEGWKSRIKEPLRRFVIRRLGHLVTYIEGDVKLARKWYGAKGVYHECLMYLSNVIDPAIIDTVSIDRSDKHVFSILLGNSADPSNNHVEVLKRLLPYKEQKIKIFAPLSYGDQEHAKKVIYLGREWFGEKFVPMTDFMPFENYLVFLKRLDVAIFNHHRQQAMGNTITLLGMGKTVFMRSEVTQWQLLNSLGIKLNDVTNLSLAKIGSEESRENATIVQSYFSKATLVRQLTSIFEERDGLSYHRSLAGNGLQGLRSQRQNK